MKRQVPVVVLAAVFLFGLVVYSKKINATFWIKYEATNSACRMDEGESNADLLVYGALNNLIHGNRSGALRLYSKLLAMWDGNGFRDRAFDGVYQTYKSFLPATPTRKRLQLLFWRFTLSIQKQ